MHPARHLPRPIAGALLALWAVSAAAAPPHLPGPIRAEVLEVVDGDTLSVRAMIWLGQVIETRVRVDGLDTPERRARCPREKELAEAAHELTRQLVGNGPVDLLDVQADKYGGRVRARVRTLDGRDLSQTLIAAGLARPYHGERRQPWCDGDAGVG